jgi:hypothetical protein
VAQDAAAAEVAFDWAMRLERRLRKFSSCSSCRLAQAELQQAEGGVQVDRVGLSASTATSAWSAERRA